MKTGHFLFREVAAGSAEYERYLHLRYEVFVEELHRIEVDPDLQVEHQEFDHFDPISRHFLGIYEPENLTACCARLILPGELGLSMVGRYHIDWEKLPPRHLQAGQVAEVSRMAISPRFRRRREDQGKPVQGDPRDEMQDFHGQEQDKRRRHQPEIVLGMYREIYHLVKDLGLDYLCAAMEPSYAKLLNRLGFPFDSIGPLNPRVIPPRRPYVMGMQALDRNLNDLHPDLYRFFNGGAVQSVLQDPRQ